MSIQTSCLTETMFEEAQERASFLDKYLKTEGKLIGPLHGLPVSIKVWRTTLIETSSRLIYITGSLPLQRFANDLGLGVVAGPSSRHCQLSAR